MTTFSTTEMGSYKACRRSWIKSSLNGEALTPWMPNKNLLLGTLVHATMADWSIAWAKHHDHSLLYPLARFNEHWAACESDLHDRYAIKQGTISPPNGSDAHAARLAAERLLNSPNHNPGRGPSLGMPDIEFENSYGEPVRDLGRAMIQNYADFYQEPFPQTYSLIEVEQTITVKVPHTRHRLEGTFDMMLADHRGRVVIPDHKTFERRPSTSELQQNDQFLRYQWMAQSALPAGTEVVGTMYNGLWKRVTPPRGRTTDDLFFRELILHDEEELQEIERYLPHEVREMDKVRRTPLLQFPNRSWSTCPGCGIQDMCLSMSRGEPIDDLTSEYTHRDRSPAWRLVEKAEA